MLQRVQAEFRSLLREEDFTESREAPPWRKFLWFWVRVFDGFVRNRSALWASALTYSSLLAFIPFLAIVVGISTSVLKSDAVRIRGWIDDVLENLVPQLMRTPEFADRKTEVVTYVLDAIEKVNSGAIGTTGVVVLLVMILFMLTRIEESMNGIWGVTQGRSWYMRMVNYWAAISLGPIVIIAAIGFSTSIRIGKARAESPTFSKEDLIDADAFATRLKKNQPDPLSLYLRGRLAPSTRHSLEEWSWEDEVPEALRADLTTDLNAVLAGDSIYTTNRFAGVSFRGETLNLLSKATPGEKQERLNRFLLEDAYPTELRRMSKTWLERLPIIGSFLLRLLPIPILASACALFYAFMPNTKVRWDAAMVGGLVAGLLWYLNNSLSVLFVAQAARNRAIYSGLAAVPVFMVSLYFFWMLLLFGAQVSYAYQNRRCYSAWRQMDRIHQHGREFVALRIMTEAARAFAKGTSPPSVASLAESLDIPGQLISQIASLLVRTRLLVETNQAEVGFLPGRPLNDIRVADVLEAMRRGVGESMPTSPDAARSIVESEMTRVVESEQQAGARTLADLVSRTTDTARPVEPTYGKVAGA